MQTILVLGAGKSSASLIRYLLDHAQEQNWQVVVGDFSPQAAAQKVKDHPRGKAVVFDIKDPSASTALIASADIVISLLPPPMHPLVAARCLEYGKHLLTASYVSPEMRGFDKAARDKGLLFLNECGLDPGIDHMSAMQVIDKIRQTGGKLISFESFTGGLIATETDPKNPWGYKFTWNPKNVVTAGQGTARFLQDGIHKYIPYQQLFVRTVPVHVPHCGDFEGYANRDSLQYIDIYQLHGIQTMLRGTLRVKGFCSAWNILVQLGCCDDTYEMAGVSSMTHRDFIDAFLPGGTNHSVEEKVCTHFGLSADAHSIKCLRWSGFFDAEPVGLERGSPAEILEHILNKKWKLDPHNKDRIVMWHRFVYEASNKRNEIQATLVITGSDANDTAMSKTVGLPLAIATRLLAENKIQARGVVIPTLAEIYEPVLKELVNYEIKVHERNVV